MPSGCFALQFVYVLVVTQCSIQGYSHIYRVGDMLKVIVIPRDIQLPTCFSVLEVKNTCLCFVRICIVLAQIM